MNLKFRTLLLFLLASLLLLSIVSAHDGVDDLSSSVEERIRLHRSEFSMASLENNENSKNSGTSKDDASSPFYYNDEDLSSIQAVGLAAAFLSACAGHANTAAFVLRPITMLSMCKPAVAEPRAVLLVPVVVALGDDPSTQYYAGVALLNLPLMVLLVIFALFMATSVALSTRYSFRGALRKGRFPGVLAAPYYYLAYQSMMGAVTLLTTPTAEPRLVIGAIVSVVLWVFLALPVLWLIFFEVPKCAVFVQNFAEVVGRAARHASRTRLIEHVNAYMEQLDAQKKERERSRRSPSPNQGGGQAVGGPPALPAGGGDFDGAASEAPTAGIQSLISSVVSKLKQWSNRSGEGSGGGDADGSGQAAADMLRRRANVHYSMLLAEQLASLDRRYLQLTDLLAGPHRWEDRIPNVEDVPLGPASTSHASLGLLGQVSGFVQANGILFEAYKKPWFVVVEILMCLVCGFAHGYRTSDDSARECLPSAGSLFVGNLVYFVLVCALDVHVSPFERGIVMFIAFTQVVASAVALMSLGTPGDDAELASYLAALLSMYIVILKGLLHAYEILSWWVTVPGVPWSAIEEYAEHYKDMDRRNMVSKGIVRTRYVELPDDRSSVYSSASHDGERVRGDPYKVRVRLEPQEVIITEDSLDFMYDSVGGRSNAYVTSRGVPLSLLPFRLAPLPSYTPLPPRTRSVSEVIRAHRKRAVQEARKKRLWEEVKHSIPVENAEVGSSSRSHLDYETTGRRMDLLELQRLADANRRMAASASGAEGPFGRGQRATSPLPQLTAGGRSDQIHAEVRDRLEQEYRRIEEIDEARRALKKAELGTEDYWKLQEAVDKESYYTDGDEIIAMKSALFRKGGFSSSPIKTTGAIQRDDKLDIQKEESKSQASREVAGGPLKNGKGKVREKMRTQTEPLSQLTSSSPLPPSSSLHNDHRATFGSEVLTRLAEIKRSSKSTRPTSVSSIDLSASSRRHTTSETHLKRLSETVSNSSLHVSQSGAPRAPLVEQDEYDML